MKINKTLAVLALSALTLLSPRVAKADKIEATLFPKVSISRSLMVDSDIQKTGINFSTGLEGNVLEIPLASLEVTKSIPPFIPPEVIFAQEMEARKRGETLSNNLFSAFLVAGGSLTFQKNEVPKYTVKAEFLFGSGIVNDYLNDGNKLLLITGFEGKGKVKTDKKFEGKVNNLESSISSLSEMFLMDSYGFSVDGYITAKSPYSNQYILIRAGIGNLFNSAKEKPNIRLSAVLQFPPLLSWMEMSKKFKIIPYASLSAMLPLDTKKVIEMSGRLGINLAGVAVYTQADYDSLKGTRYSTGLDFNL